MSGQAKNTDPHIMIAITPDGIDQVTCVAGDAEENAKMLAALLDGGAKFSIAIPQVGKGDTVKI